MTAFVSAFAITFGVGAGIAAAAFVFYVFGLAIVGIINLMK